MKILNLKKISIQKVNLNGISMVKVTIQPGWNWKEHMSDIAGTEWCENRPIGIVVSGKYHAKHNDGTEFDILPGQAYVVELIFGLLVMSQLLHMNLFNHK